MTLQARTHVTLLTPPGTGAIALMRLSGPDAVTISQNALRTRNTRPLTLDQQYRLHLAKFVDRGEVVDDVVASLERCGDECTVDIASHGGIRIVQRILQAFEDSGATVCEQASAPVSKWRAANRIEEEAIELMVRAKTERALRFLAFQKRILVSHINTCVVKWENNGSELRSQIKALVAAREKARALTNGVKVVIIGPPNSGKSTLFNALVGRHAAVVSPVAGATRDWVSQTIEIHGVPVTLVDTAGRSAAPGTWQADDPVQLDAVKAGEAVASEADVCLLMFDGSAPVSAEVVRAWKQLIAPKHLVIVLSKLDLGISCGPSSAGPRDVGECRSVLRISARSGARLPELIAEIIGPLGLADESQMVPSFFTQRQIDLANVALSLLDRGVRLFRTVLLEQLVGRPTCFHNRDTRP